MGEVGFVWGALNRKSVILIQARDKLKRVRRRRMAIFGMGPMNYVVFRNSTRESERDRDRD